MMYGKIFFVAKYAHAVRSVARFSNGGLARGEKKNGGIPK